VSVTAESLRQSEDFCRDVLKQANTSFALPFMTLPKRKRSAFEVIYAFMRLCDDASDDAAEGDRAARIDEWRQHLRSGLAGDVERHAILPALAAVIHERQIPQRYFEDLLDGTQMDLAVNRYATFQELYGYCYRVAGVVGLVSLRIFGLKDPTPERWRRADELAEACGIAFQLTNILRDVAEDADRDRIYLPAEDLAAHGLGESDIRARVCDARFVAMMKAQAERAERYYAQSAPLVDMLAPDARPCFSTMRGVYHGILEKIVAQGYDVWSERARVPLVRKIGIAARAWFLRFNA
jgi:15-cis-phytoene synthase